MKKKLQIVGIAGTNGAGKDTVGQILADHHNYLFISVTELLRDEARRRGQPTEREVLRTISAEWRRESGLGVLIDKAVEAYEKVKNDYSGVVMASLRNPGEADRIHELGGTLLWIDADPKVRYHRVQANKEVRARHHEDSKTYKQFIAEEKAEMSHLGDAATLNMAGVKDKSDLFIDNSHEDIDLFRKDVEKTLGLN
jgi:cytidylate kinase